MRVPPSKGHKRIRNPFGFLDFFPPIGTMPLYTLLDEGIVVASSL